MALAVTGHEVVAVVGWQDVLAVGDTLYACGAAGRFAASRDGGASWQPIEVGTPGGLHGLALAADGAVWLCGDAGYLARVHGGAPVTVELGTPTRLVRVYAVRDEIVVLGDEGTIRRWTEAGIATATPGGAVTALAITPRSWIAVGRAGFVARSPDGAWYSRITMPLALGAIDLAGVAMLADGRLIAVGDRGCVLLSTDDGRSWAGVAIGLAATTRLTSVRRWKGGAVIGTDAGVVARLRDDGAWQLEVAPPAPPPLPGAIDPDFDFEDDDDVAVVDDEDDEDDDDGDALDSDHEAAAVAIFDSAPVAKVALDDDDFDAAFASLAADPDPLPPIAIGRAHTAEHAAYAELVEPAPATDDDFDLDDDSGDDSAAAHGLHGVERALDPLYHGAEPWRHLTGEVAEPLHAISIYRRDLPTPHFHVVTYGFTELFDKDSDDLDVSGYGFELSLRIARCAGDDLEPTWAIELVRSLAGYVFATGNRFAIGHSLAPRTPLAPGHETAIAALAFADDPELGDIQSDHGRAEFLEVVGITADEHALVQDWSTESLVELLAARSPLLVTDLARRSILDDPHVAAEIHRRVRLEGSSEAVAFAPDLEAVVDGDTVCLVLAASFANVLARAMRGRLRHGRTYELRGRAWNVVLEPSDVLGYHADEDDARTVILTITPDVASELEATLDEPELGRHQLRSWSRLQVEVR